MRKKTILLFVFDGFADWEPAYALAGISKSDRFKIRTIALDKTPKRSMGGVAVCPDYDFLPDVDLNDLDNSNVAMLVLPGGVAWEERTNGGIAPLVTHCFENQIPVAAICGATVFLAELGLLNEIEHTSNGLTYLHELAKNYSGGLFYRHVPSIAAGGIITAGGVAAIEFAESIFETLNIREMESVSGWFRYFEKAEL